MKKLFIAGAIVMASIFPVYADTMTIYDPKVDGCITREQVVSYVFGKVPDATAEFSGYTVIFSSPSKPHVQLVVTFDKDNCAILRQDIVK